MQPATGATYPEGMGGHDHSLWKVDAHVVLFDPDGRTWLGLRTPTMPYSPSTWGIVGGHLRDGELPIDGAIRKVHEETGIRLTRADLNPQPDHVMFDAGTDGEGDARVRTFFFAKRRITDLEIKNPQPHRNVEWRPFALDGLPSGGRVLPFFPEFLFNHYSGRQVSYRGYKTGVRPRRRTKGDVPHPEHALLKVDAHTIMFDPDRRMWLGLRTKTMPYAPNVWGIVGGHLRSNELPQEAAIRKTFEETGVELSPEDLATVPDLVLFDPGEAGVGEPRVRTFFVVNRAVTVDEMRNPQPDRCVGWDRFAADRMPSPRRVLPFMPEAFAALDRGAAISARDIPIAPRAVKVAASPLLR